MTKIIIAAVLAGFFWSLFYIGLCVFEWRFPLGDAYDNILRLLAFAMFVGSYLGQFKKVKQCTK